ncbi:TRAP transporter substrate-binding protein [Nocardioides houyundeii]|uniref:TRAP transporter substrate-binding protein n=1 Tax=Nocardioides houyundeii TaxID=2045452 RepID=UPI000DF201C6|nr:TRAP transporter substrate-binding protein DctP [Nocardioides houyundeii]
MVSKRPALGLLTAMVLAGAAACGGSGEGDSQSFDMYTHVGLDHPVNIELQAFADEVEEKTEGRIKFVLRPAGEVPYTQDEALDTMRSNLMDATLATTGSVGGDEPLFDVPSFPFLIGNEEALEAVRPVINEHFDPVLEQKHNMVRLGEYVWPPQELWLADDSVSELADAEGAKVRVFNTSFATASDEMGMEPVTMPAAEVNSSIQRGVIEGAWTSVSHAIGSNLPELAKSVVRTDAGYIYDFFGIRADIWKDLSAEDQEILRTAGDNATERLMEVQIGSGEDEFWQEVEDAGTNIVVPDAAVMDAIVDSLSPKYDEWASERGPEAEALLADIRTALDED